MLKFMEAAGRTEEEAIAVALDRLGLDRDDVSVEVLNRAKAGFLGIGAAPARVKVSYEGPDEAPAAKPAEAPAAKPAAKAAPAAKVAPAAKPAAKVAPAHKAAPTHVVDDAVPCNDDTAAAITAFLTGLLTHMGVTAQVAVALSPRESYEVTITGDHVGSLLIGRRGATLDAIQQLTGYAINRDRANRVRVHVDAEGYRARRDQSLEELAQRVAAKVVETRHAVTLEPMNAYERHVVHTALQDLPHIATHSTGVEPNRRTVVSYKA